MRAVNLLPGDTAQRKSFEGPGILIVGLVVVFALVIGGLGMTYMSASSSISSSQDELAAVHAQIAALPPSQRPPSAAEQQLASDRSVRVQALNTALSTRVSWDRVLRQVDLVLPSDVWLTDLNGQAPLPAATAAVTPGAPVPTTPAPSSSSGTCTAGSFCIAGYTYSQESVARLLTRLAAVPALTGVTLVSSASQTIGKQTVYHFAINAQLSTGGGA